MSVSKLVLVDHDFGGAARPKNLPAASSNGHAVRYEEHTEVEANVDDLVTLTGVAENATNFGSFSGSTISDNGTLKDILQELETEAETNQLTINSASQSVLSITNGELKMESLAITDVEVDTSATSLGAWITANATHTLAMGDVLILTSATDKMEMTWICNTNSPSNSPADAADFTRLQADIQANDVRSFLAGTSDEIDYNSTTGVFSFSANAAENIAPTSHTWVGIGTPSTVQDFMEKTDEELSNIQGGTSLEVGSVTTAKLAADAVTAAKLADDAVVTANIVDANVTTAKIAPLNVTTAKIAADAVTGAKIADDSIDSEHLVDGSVDLAHLAADSVDGTKIADDSVDSEHLAAGSIDAEHFSADCVDSASIAAGAVDLEHMSHNSVDSAQIVDGSLDFVHIAAAVYETDLASSASASKLCTAGSVKSYVDGKSYVRKLFTAQSLTASTAASLTHSLGQKYVDVRMFDDADDKEVDFELTLTDANNISVEVSVSGTYSVLVIG